VVEERPSQYSNQTKFIQDAAQESKAEEKTVETEIKGTLIMIICLKVQLDAPPCHACDIALR
jgi:hypothetical protein